MAKKASKSWKEERRKRAWVVYQAGWPQKQIAEALGVSKGAVSQWIKAGKGTVVSQWLYIQFTATPSFFSYGRR